MKTKFIHIASILTIASAPAVFAQGSEMADKVVMRQGTFWPKNDVANKVWVGNTWTEYAFDIANPQSVNDAIALLPSLRNDSSYEHMIATLNAALGVPSLPPNQVNNALRNELILAATSPPESLQRSADWSQVNLSNANLSWRDLREMNVTGEQLNAVSNINFANLSGMNLSGWTPSGTIAAVNLTGATGISGSTFENVEDMNQVVLPIGIDMSEFSGQGKSLAFVDFSGTNLTGPQLNGVGNDNGSLHGTNLSGLNLSGWDTSGVFLHNANLANVDGLTAADIAASRGINGLILTGTGITRSQLEAAIVGRTPTWNFNINTVIF